MKTILLTTIFTITLLFFAKAQQTQQLNSKDGLLATYELTRLDSSKTKETFIAIGKIENKNDYDVYYSVPASRNASGQYEINLLENKAVSQMSVRNSTSLFGDNINMVGNETKFITTDNLKLFVIPKSGFITSEKEFKVKTGNKPVLTNTFLIASKKIEDFDIALNEKQVNGDWISTCGNIQLTLSYTLDNTNQQVIKQIVNGKEIVWRKTSNNAFEKVGDESSKLTYSKDKRCFNYSSSDGVICTWTKKIKYYN